MNLALPFLLLVATPALDEIVLSGQVADLSGQPEAERHIDAGAIADLVRQSARGVRITGAKLGVSSSWR